MTNLLQVRALLAVVLCAVSFAHAQTYPAKPILMMVPLAAGSSLDVVLRRTATRSPLLPAVPTVAESGLPGYEFVTWMGMFAPLNTPKEIIARVNAERTPASSLNE